MLHIKSVYLYCFILGTNNTTRQKARTIHLCQFCSYSSHLLGNLKRHMLIHTGERPFKCAMCDYSCNQKDNLKKHMILHRRNMNV